MEHLTYTDSQGVEVAQVANFDMDLQFGGDRNDFEVHTVAKIDPGSYVYISGTEYGGIIDAVKTDSADSVRVYKGRTWHGILSNKVIRPDSGQEYYTFSGNISDAISAIIKRANLSSVFKVGDVPTVSINYQYERYTDAYSGIRKMLEKVGYRPTFTKRAGLCEIGAVLIRNISDEADSDLIDFTVQRNRRVVNHVVALGQGDLAERVVIDLYADANGIVSENQTFTGVDEIEIAYDFAQADEQTLRENAKSRLESFQEFGEVNVEDSGGGITAGVGDYITARDNANGTTATGRVDSIVASVTAGQLTIKPEIGGEGAA